MVLDRYCSDSTDLLQILNLAEQSQFDGMLRANKCGGGGSSGVRRCEEELSDAVVVEETDEEDWNLDGVMTGPESNGSGLRGKFRELQTEFRAVYTEVPAGLVDVVRMTKRSITLEEHQRECD